MTAGCSSIRTLDVETANPAPSDESLTAEEAEGINGHYRVYHPLLAGQSTYGAL